MNQPPQSNPSPMLLPADGRTLYRTWGAHSTEAGTQFRVWAPNAEEVSVICDRNHWQAGHDSLDSSDNGVWSGLISHIQPGECYKYAIRTRSGQLLEKTDPVGFFSEMRPANASVVWRLDQFQWNDGEWLKRRQETDWQTSPLAVYELHPGSWKRADGGAQFLNYRQLAHQLVDYLIPLGFTHLQLMPVTEHPFDGSWGYQTTGYFAPTSRFGTPDDFQYFVDYLHQHHLGVLIDWVPGHFPVDGHGLAGFDGTCLYEHADPRQGFHPDWNTLIFNYGRQEVREFLHSSARFWCDVYHVDGLRVDAVASMLYLDYSRADGEWIPNAEGGRENTDAVRFLQELNTELHAQHPGILTIAEESTAWPGVSRPCYTGGLGFTLKWDMGWMNDTLRFLQREPVHRRFHLDDLTFRSVYASSESFVLALSHDEVVHGKKSLISRMPGDQWQQFAGLRLLLCLQYGSAGKKHNFMGTEFGQWGEWNFQTELDWPLLEFETHRGIQRLCGDLNSTYTGTAALHAGDHQPGGQQWLIGDDTENCVIAWIRSAEDRTEHVLVVSNLTPVVRHDYRIGVPAAGRYIEILNSDDRRYGGSGVSNAEMIAAEAKPAHGCEMSIALSLPPLATVFLQHRSDASNV